MTRRWTAAAAWATKEQLGNRAGVANSLHRMGVVHQHRGDYDAALDHYRRSLAIEEQLGNRAGVAISLGRSTSSTRIGATMTRRWTTTAAAWPSPSSWATGRGGAALHQIGSVHYLQGDYDAALDHYRRSLAIKEQLGDRAGAAKTLNAIGIVFRQRGEYDKALDHYQRSLQEAEALGDRRQVATVLHAIGIVHQDRGDV